MKNKIIKTVSVVLCAALMCGAAFMGIYAVAANTGKKSDDTTGETVSSAPVVGDTSVTKKETVYVIAGADGSVKKLIVSDWIKNDGKSDILTDVTEAKDIVNVKGDEEYVMGGENTYVWNANGNDIYYQGNIEKELPVSIKITYELNGSVISADEIAGKSGKVKIRFDYINNEVRTVNINGNDEKIYVPFAMLTGIILDTDTFSSVEVSNGKIINDGDRIAVIGIALPGLAESLGADSGKLDIPSYVEITADTKNFSLKNTVTVASNEIFGGLNSENTDALDGKISALTDAVGELTDGSSDLYDGVCTLLDKSTELVDGINKLYDGAVALKQGTVQLRSGSSDIVRGANQLYSGLGKLNSKNSELNAGAKQIFDTLLSTASAQLASAGITDIPELTIENYNTTLAAILPSLSEESIRTKVEETVKASVNAKRDVIEAGATAAVRQQIEQKIIMTQVLASMGMTEETYKAGIANGTVAEEMQAAVNAVVSEKIQDETTLGAISGIVDAQMGSEEIRAIIAVQTENKVKELIATNLNSPETKAQADAAVAKAAAGAASIKSLISQLDSYNKFYKGLGEYTEGVSEAYVGTGKLKSGAISLENGAVSLDAGAKQLLSGLFTMKESAPALIDGIGELKDGAMQLRDGLAQFSEKIKEKLEEYGVSTEELSVRIKALSDASKEYTTFAGASEGTESSVKFIYRTDSVKRK